MHTGRDGMEGRQFPVVRQGSKILPRGQDPDKATCREVEQVMIDWWRDEVERAEAFLKSFVVHENQSDG